MTSEIVRPLSLPAADEVRTRRSRAVGGRRPPRMPHLPVLNENPVNFGFTTIDVHGRLVAPELLKLLGWEPGAALDVTVQGGLVLMTLSTGGTQVVTAKWHVGLPAHVRHWHGLSAGTRLLLVADQDTARLIVHPPAVFHSMILRLHGDVLGGDVA